MDGDEQGGAGREAGASGAELDDDATFQRVEWVMQRVGWVVMAGILVAAGAGFFGPGPVSHSEVRSPDGALSVHYSRYGRAGGSEGLGITVAGDALADGTVEIEIARAYLQQMKVDAIVPDPVEQTVDDDVIRLVVRVAPGARRTTVELSLTPGAMGSTSGRIGLETGQVVRFKQFFYP